MSDMNEPAGVVGRLSGAGGAPHLLVRRLSGAGEPVIYVHGATFPSALSVAYRFGGRSWMDDLAERGFDAWGFDFPGFGGSGPPANPPGRADTAVEALERVVDHVLATTGRERVALLAHSWGSMVAGLFAVRRPERVSRLALFGPFAQRDAGVTAPALPDRRPMTIADQLARFVEDVPPDHPSVLIEPELETWGPCYLATDPGAGARTPPSVMIPTGPIQDIAAAWSGRLAYDPAQVTAPSLVVRGEWDSLCNDADAAWLCSRLGGPAAHDVKLPKGTHLMHLEHGRTDLFAAVGDFLEGRA